MSKWTKVPIIFTVELGRELGAASGDHWNDLTYEKEIPPSVLEEVTRLVPVSCEGVELDFDITSSGSYSPAVMYLKNGDPGYPEEHEEERVCNGVFLLLGSGEYVRDAAGKRVKLKCSDELEGLYQSEIDDAELPSVEQDYDGPDCEDY
jgi:hypothetical protein